MNTKQKTSITAIIQKIADMHADDIAKNKTFEVKQEGQTFIVVPDIGWSTIEVFLDTKHSGKICFNGDLDVQIGNTDSLKQGNSIPFIATISNVFCLSSHNLVFEDILIDVTSA